MSGFGGQLPLAMPLSCVAYIDVGQGISAGPLFDGLYALRGPEPVHRFGDLYSLYGSKFHRADMV